MPFPTLIFQSGFETNPVGGTSPDFNQSFAAAGESVVISNRGCVGKSLQVNVQDTDSQCGVTKALTAPCKVFQFFFRLPANNNLQLNQGKLIFKTWANANFTSDLMGLFIKKVSSTNITFGITSNTSNFANTAETSSSYHLSNVMVENNSVTNNQDTWFKIVISLQEVGFISLYIDGAIVPTLRIPATGYTSSTAIRSFHLGKFLQSPTTGWGQTSIFFDCLKVYDNHFIQTTDSDRATAAAKGWIQRYVSPEGCVIRYPETEAKQDPFFQGPRKVDSCSEGQAYALMIATQVDDKAVFDTVEQYNTTVYDRGARNVTGSVSFMSWLHDPTKADTPGIPTFPDNAFAIDADADRCVALLWAHAKWGSSGTINYFAKARTIARAIVDICGFLGSNNLMYLLSGGNAGTLTLQNGFNVSYFQNYLFFKLKQLDTPYATKYQQLIDGSNDFMAKATDNANGLATTTGLFPNWAGLDPNNNQAINPPEGWMDTHYTYDAIRTAVRSYMSFLWHQDQPAQTLIAGNLYNFMAGQWNNGAGTIWAEYFQNGNIKGNYESTMMYSLNSWIFKLKGDNVNYNAIINTKVKTTYSDSAAGDAYSYYTGLTQNGYFGTFWASWTMLLHQNLITDFGATVNPALAPDQRYYLSAVYPELNTGKIRTYL
jgi:endo-1,4-beta-D-glucanase Y